MKTNKKPFVSIGMPVYNGERYITQALDSLLSQDYDNFELIISDNASSDSSPDICLEYKNKDDRIKFYRNDKNIAAKDNFRRVLELSSGQYFMWAACDDLWTPNYISSLLKALTSDENSVLAFSQLNNIDENGNICREYPNLHLLSSKAPLIDRLNNIIWFREEDGKANLVYGLIRSDILKQIDIFKPYGFGNWGVDYLLVFRLALFGKFLFINDSCFYKRLTEESISRWANTSPEEYCRLIQGYFQGYRTIIKESNLQDTEKDILLMSIAVREGHWYSRILGSNTIEDTAFKIRSMVEKTHDYTAPSIINNKQHQHTLNTDRQDTNTHKPSQIIDKTILFLSVGRINYDCNINFYEPLKAIFKEVINYNYMQRIEILGKKAMNEEIINIVKSKKPDYVFIHTYQDQIELSTLDKINTLGAKTIAWFSDDHWRFDDYSRFLAPHVFCSITTDKYTVDKYKSLGFNVIKSQWASNQHHYREINTPLLYDVTFVGQNYGKRKDNLFYLKNKNVPLSVFGRGFGTFLEFDEIIKIFNASKINLNFSGSSRDDNIKQIKGRIFEVPMCKGFLLTEYADGIEDYFEIGKEIECFDNMKDALGKTQYYLKHEDRRLEIAEKGHMRALRDHTWEKRLRDLFLEVERLEKSSSVHHRHYWITTQKDMQKEISCHKKHNIPYREKYEMGFHGDSYLLTLIDHVLTRCDAFIKTGTYMGDSLEYVARNFSHLHIFSCEPRTEHITVSRNKLRPYLHNITLEQVKSPDFLYKIVDDHPDLVNKDVAFWLDAHSFGYKWPLKDEIRFITETFKRAYIFIDDFKIPGRPEFQYDIYDGQECSWEFIHDEMCTDKKYLIYLPKYKEKTSRHHPLVGWILIEFGHATMQIPDSLKDHLIQTSAYRWLTAGKFDEEHAVYDESASSEENSNSYKANHLSDKSIHPGNEMNKNVKHAIGTSGGKKYISKEHIKRVLLTTSAAPNQSPFSTTEKRPPIGLGFLISVLRNAGHKVFFIDNYLRPDNFLETDFLQRNRIDYVGIYSNTICYRDTLRMFYRLEYLRRTGRWGGKIIVGGPHTTVALDTIPDFVDHIVQGEGEKAILDIVEERISERIVKYPRIKDLDNLPMPAWDYFLKLPYNWGVDWFSGQPVFTMNTSRGCPFRCTFCSVGSIWGKKYTYFSAERIVSDIEYLIKEYGAKGIYFREDNFTLNRKRLVEFCELLLKKGINIPWACETRVSNLNKDVIELMSRAGACGFYFGVESGSQRILDFLKKDIKVEQTRRAFELCHRFGINTAASVIVGVPTETQDDIRQTYSLLKDIKPTITWFNVFVGIPNSELYQYAIKNKLYEFIDDRGLVYLKGHNERVKKFYGGHINASIPSNQGGKGERTNPEISVVMPVYNTEKYVEGAVRSILTQTYQDFEFLIIDDGSTDNTREILKRFDDPRIRIITNPKNLGLSKSLNIAINEAKGKYIARMDADDISIPFRLETQLDFLSKNPDYALVGSSYYQIDEKGEIISLVRVLTDDNEIRAGLTKQNWFGHGSVMMLKNAFLQCGGYDETFKFAQDYDLWLRIADKYKVANIEEPLYQWRSSAGNISSAKAAEQKFFASLAIDKAKEREKARTINNSKRPLVSVIVPTYNRPDMLTETLESILNQSYQNYEIIVVNDGGVDVEGIITRLNTRGNITYVRHNMNKGLAASRNTGIRLAKGKYLAYLDDDDVFYPNHIETLVKLLEESDYKVAYTDAHRAHQVPDGDSYKIVSRDIPYSVDFSKDLLLVCNISPVNCFMHERECIEKVGLFDETLTTHEDWDFWIRLSRMYDFKHIKKVTTEFRDRRDGSTMTSSNLPDFLKTTRIIYKRYSGYTMGREDIQRAQEQNIHLLENEISKHGPSTSMKCSIIIPVFNQLEYTKKCLEALIENTPGDLYEVIIVDNGSTDGTKEFLKCLEGDVKIITNQENLGFSKACNQGAREASGAYLVFLNNDTIPRKGWLDELVRVADANEDIAVVGSKLLFPDNTIQHAGVAIADSILPGHIYRGRPSDFPPANKPRDFQVVTGACMLVKKDIFFDVGGFDEAYVNGYEDVDLCFKIRESGKRVFYNPRCVLTHFECKSEGRRDKMDNDTKILFNRWGGRVKPDYERYLMEDGFRIEETPGGEKKWVYHEELFKPVLSIVIVTYNSLGYIEKCLDSIKTQTPIPYEVIVIDNNSSDGTRDFLKGLKNVKVMLNNENKGFSKATNQGIKLARGEYIVFLNPDTVVTWDWAWHMMLHFNEGVGAVGPVSKYAAGLQRYELYMKDKSLREIDINKLAEKLYTWNTGKSMETKLLTGFCMMTKKEILDKVGMLDEDLFLGSDDLEFSWRLREKGYRLVVATDTFIYHKAQASFTTEPEEKMKRLTQESQDTLYLKLQKYYGKGKVPSSKELWGMDWFRPSNKLTRPSPPLTSIIMLTFNQLDYTRKCLQSIEKHTDSRYELILVDNGSTDGTTDFLKDFARSRKNVILVLNKENLGFAKGNNQGIEKARGDYILLLNNDVVVTEGWLERMVDYMESNPDVGMVGPLSNNVSGPQKVKDVPSGSNLDDIHAFARRIARENAGKIENVMRLVGFCLLIRKDVIDLIGALDENYGSGNFQDDDLCLRSLIAGFRHVILKDVFIQHYGSKTFEGNNIDYNSSLDKNRDYFARKWHGIVEMEDGGYKVKLEPKDRLDALISMGEMEHEMGRLNSAVNIFKKALMSDPLNSRILNDLGVIQWELGERESAIRTFRKALDINPKDNDARFNLEQALAASNRPGTI